MSVQKTAPSRRSRTLFRIAISIVVLGLIAVGAYVGRAALRASRAADARERGLAAFDRREWEPALGDLGMAVAFDRENPELLLKYGEARANVPQPEGRHLAEAARIYQLAIEFGAPELETRRKMLSAYMQLGALVETQETAQAILRLDARDRGALDALLLALMARGRDGEAISMLEKAIADSPQDVSLRFRLIGAMARAERPTDEILAKLDAWTAELGAPRGIHDIRAGFLLEKDPKAAVELKPPFDDGWRPESVEEARYRARLLQTLGRTADACLALRRARESGLGDLGLLREEFRMRLFSGDSAGALDLSDGLAASASADEKALGAELRAIVGVAGSDSRLALEALERFRPAQSAPMAQWRDALLESFQNGSVPRDIRNAAFAESLEPAAIAAYELRRARTLLTADEAARAAAAADVASTIARGEWADASRELSQAYLKAGNFGLAMKRAREAFARDPSRLDFLSLVLEADVAQRLARANAGRDISGLARDARIALAAPGIGADTRRIAIQALILANEDELARAEARKLLADPSLGALDAVPIATVATALARLEKDPSIALSAADQLASMSADPWTIAEVRCIAAELSGDNERGLSGLLEAAGTNRANLAKAADFADRLLPDRAVEIYLKSLPEGAAQAVLSRAVERNPDLARRAIQALERGGRSTRTAIARLRLATLLPNEFPLPQALLDAEEERRSNPNDSTLLVAMGEALLKAPVPEPKQAAELFLRAYRLDTDRIDHLMQAMRAHGLSGDKTALAATAEQLLEAAGGDVGARRAAIAALCEAGQSQRAVAAARALAIARMTDEDVALAGRTQALAGDLAGAEATLRAVLGRDGDWTLSTQSLVAVLRAAGRQDEAALLLRTTGIEDDPIAAKVAAVEEACAAGKTELIAGLDPAVPEFAELTRTLVLRGGACAAVALAHLERTEGPEPAARARLAAQTFSRVPAELPTIADATAATRAAPTDWTAWIAAIRTASRRGDLAAAANAVRDARRTCPLSLPLLRDSIDALVAIGAFEEARTFLAPYRGSAGFDPSVRLAAAIIELADGEGARALNELGAISDPSVRAANGEIYARVFALAGRLEDAARAGADAALVQPDILAMLPVEQARALFAALEARGNLSPVVRARLLAKLVLRVPTDAALAAAAADASRAVLASTADVPLERATSAFSAAVASGDESAIASAREAMIAGTAAEVRALLDIAVAPSGGDPRAKQVAGILANNEADALARRGGDLVRAVKLAERARALLPGRPEPEDTLARALIASGRFAEAQQAVAAGAITADRCALRAEAWLGQSRRTEALEEIARAAQALERQPYAPIDLDARIKEIDRRIRALPITG